MFAYCENNPVMFVDPNGTMVIDGALVTGFAVLCFGILLTPFIVDFVIPAIGELISDVVEGVETIVTTISSNLEDSKAEEKEEVLPPLSDDTIIYRHHASKTENLAPRPNKDFDGVSFSTTKPKPGLKTVATTVGAVNATGILKAVRTSETHILIVPTNDSVLVWMQQGMNSAWSKVLSAIVFELE